MSQSTFSSLIAFVAICCVGLGCGNRTNEKETSSPTPAKTEVTANAQIADLTKLIRQPPQVFDKAFGKAVEAFETDDPGTIPGEMRDYKIPGVSSPQTITAGMTVRFYKGKAVEIMVDLPSPTSSSAAALLQVGIDTQGVAPVRTPVTDYWPNLTFKGVTFKTVWAYKLDTGSSLFTTVKAASE